MHHVMKPEVAQLLDNIGGQFRVAGESEDKIIDRMKEDLSLQALLLEEAACICS